MQIETEHAPATRLMDDGPAYFCSDHCAHRFDADPQRFPRATRVDTADVDMNTIDDPSAVGDATQVDPVCGMQVDPATATHAVEHDSRQYVFCGPGCRAAFQTDPGPYLSPAAPDRDDVQTLSGGPR